MHFSYLALGVYWTIDPLKFISILRIILKSNEFLEILEIGKIQKPRFVMDSGDFLDVLLYMLSCYPKLLGMKEIHEIGLEKVVMHQLLFVWYTTLFALTFAANPAQLKASFK